MSSSKFPELLARYTDALRNYVQTHSESALFSISKLSKEFLSEGLGPDEVTNMHSVAMGKIVSEMTGEAAINAFHSSTEPLLEIMMNYAMSYHSSTEKHRRQIAEYEAGDKTRELEKLASVGLVLLGMTGEMINQMESIRAYTEMMTGGGISRAKEFSQALTQEVLQAQQIVNTAFLYSRKMAARSDERIATHLHRLLIEAIDVVRNVVKLDSIAIQTNYKTPVQVNVNPAEMQQALVNLIASAIDAIKGSGSLMISVTADENEKRNYAVLKIISGSDGTAKRMDVFSLPMSKSNVALSIATNIIKKHGGESDIKNTNSGIIITVKLPVANRMDNFLEGIAKPEKLPAA